MNFLKRVRWAYFLLSVALIAAGVCLAVWPAISMDVACMAAGIGAMVYGLIKIVIYFVRHVEHMVEQYDFSMGLLCIAAGAFLVIHPGKIVEMVPQVVAVYMICDCVFKLQVSLDAKRLGSGAWFLMLLVTLVVAVWGVCLLLQPFGLDAYLSVLLAGGLIADGVMNLLAVIFIAAVVKKPAAEGGPVTKLPDPMTAVAASPAAPAPQPAPPAPAPAAVEEPAPQVKDIIASSREKTNQPEGKGGIFSFFKKKDKEADDGAVAEINFDMDEEG